MAPPRGGGCQRQEEWIKFSYTVGVVGTREPFDAAWHLGAFSLPIGSRANGKRMRRYARRSNAATRQRGTATRAAPPWMQERTHGLCRRAPGPRPGSVLAEWHGSAPVRRVDIPTYTNPAFQPKCDIDCRIALEPRLPIGFLGGNVTADRTFARRWRAHSTRQRWVPCAHAHERGMSVAWTAAAVYVASTIRSRP